ncbi:hypothetical protein Dimus_000249 [Dionaea muscipula]
MEKPDTLQETPITVEDDFPDADEDAQIDFLQLQTQNDYLLAELRSLGSSYHSLEAKWRESESKQVDLQMHKTQLLKTIEELSRERDGFRDEVRRLEELGAAREEEFARRVEDARRERESLEREIYEGMREREELVRRIDVGVGEKEDLMKEIEGHKKRVAVLEDEKREMDEGFSRGLESIDGIKGSLVRLIEILDEEKVEDHVAEGSDQRMDQGSNPSEESKESGGSMPMGLEVLTRFTKRVEGRLSGYREKVKKEKRELENSVVSLTEENRDINSLLRIALVEKEAVEKSLNKLKGNNEQKRVALLQIAERGLQRVGFGFMMGTTSPNEAPTPSVENTSSAASNVSDSSECEEEVVSLASTVEKIMKNLRLEISNLRRSLEESRSDIERLQSLSGKQAQQITEQTLYIKELEDRETLLTQNVEELLMEIKATEEEVSRWREACELEAEAGKNIVEERDKLTNILKQELVKARAALEVSNSKLKLKEELAAAAMAAQAAAEKSLELADSRTAGLHERIEELTRQLEEAENRERNSRRKVRRICWPWQTIKLNTTASASATAAKVNVRRLLPEMQTLLSI